MRRARWAAVATAVFWLATSSALAQPPTSNVAFGPYSWNLLDACVPAVPPAATVVLIHGGGWIAGDKAATSAMCATLAQQGLLVLNINYRHLAAGDPSTYWPGVLADAQLAMRWARLHASDYGADPTRVCAAGVSVGAQLAAFLGVRKFIEPASAVIDPMGETALYADQSPAARCVADFFGPVDLTQFYDPILPELRSEIVEMVRNLPAYRYGFQAALQQASPLFYVAPDSAPMMIVQGSGDHTVVPATQSRPLVEALQFFHVPARYFIYRGGHSFTGLSAAQRNKLYLLAAQFIKAYASYKFSM